MSKTKKIILGISFVIITFILSSKVQAATASISSNKNSMNVGETATITVSINAAAWEVHVTGAVSQDYVGYTDNAENGITTKKINFTPSSPGSYKINMNGNVSDGSTNKISTVADSIEINVSDSSKEPDQNEGNQTTTKSSNANLSNLGIKPNDFTGFKSGTTKYYVTVENDVEEVSVYANTQSAKATVSGVGRKKLKEGSNPLSVTVTAEDGTKKTYTIYVTRKTADESTVPNVVDEPETPTEEQKLRLTAIALQEDLNLMLTPTFNSEVFEYTLEVGADLDAIEISGIPNINDAKVTISGNEELEEGENIITLKVSKTDMEDVIYTIKVTKKAESNEVPGTITTFQSTMPKPFYVAEKIEKDAQLIMYLAIAITVIGIGVCGFEYAKTRKLAYADEYEEEYDNRYETEENNSWQQMNSREEMREDFDSKEEIQGRTVDLVSPEEWEEEEKPRKRKGKHF